MIDQLDELLTGAGQRLAHAERSAPRPSPSALHARARVVQRRRQVVRVTAGVTAGAVATVGIVAWLDAPVESTPDVVAVESSAAASATESPATVGPTVPDLPVDEPPAPPTIAWQDVDPGFRLFWPTLVATPDGFLAVAWAGVGGEGGRQAWTSPDGTSWERTDLDGIPSDASILRLLTGGAGYLASGSVGGAPATWSSSDGHTWTTAALPDAGQPALSPYLRWTVVTGDLAVADDGFVVIRGFAPMLDPMELVAPLGLDIDPGNLEAVMGDDGDTITVRTRSLGADIATFSARELGIDLATLGSGVVTMVSSSPDGVSWTSPAPLEPGADGPAASVRVVGGVGGFLAAGPDLGADLWASPDGGTWHRVDVAATFGSADLTLSIGRTGDRFVTLVTPPSTSFSSAEATQVWTSVDGLTWERIGPLPDDGESDTRYDSYSVVSGPDGLLVFGEAFATRGLGEPAHTGFLTRDGVGWSVPIAGSPIAPVAAVHGDRVVVANDPNTPGLRVGTIT